MKKEEIINEGLQMLKGNQENVEVKLTLKYKKHEEESRRRSCMWCNEPMPYSTEFCTCRKPDENWMALRH